MKTDSSSERSLPPVLQQRAHPAVIGVTILVVVIIVGWWAQVNGLMPGFDKWRMKQEQDKMYTLARRVGGDYSKLSEEEKKWVEKTSNGHGRMAMGMYSGKGSSNPAQPKPPAEPPHAPVTTPR